MLVLLSSRASLRPTIIACLRKHGVARPERRRSAWIVRNRSWTGCNGRTMAAAHAAPGCARSRRCRCGRYDARAASLPRPGTPRPRRASAGRPSAASPSAGASAEPGWRRVDRKTHDASPSVGAARRASATEVPARDLTSLPRTGTLRRRRALGRRPYDHALRADGRFALKERPASVAAPVTTAPSQPMPPPTPFGSPLDTPAQSLARDAARDRCFRRSSSGAHAVQSSRGATAIGPGFRRARATPSRSGGRDRVARLIRPFAPLCSARCGRWRRR